MRCGHCKRNDAAITVAHVRACQLIGSTAATSTTFTFIPNEPRRLLVSEEGFYYKPDSGEYAKVVRSNGGYLYAKVWDPDTESWDYTAGLLRLLYADQKVDEQLAGLFGDLYNRCIFCTNELTDERPGCSVDRGYGPKCAENNGLPWGPGSTVEDHAESKVS